MKRTTYAIDAEEYEALRSVQPQLRKLMTAHDYAVTVGPMRFKKPLFTFGQLKKIEEVLIKNDVIAPVKTGAVMLHMFDTVNQLIEGDKP